MLRLVLGTPMAWQYSWHLAISLAFYGVYFPLHRLSGGVQYRSWPLSNGLFASTASGGTEKGAYKGCGSHSLHPLGFRPCTLPLGPALGLTLSFIIDFVGSALRPPRQFS